MVFSVLGVMCAGPDYSDAASQPPSPSAVADDHRPPAPEAALELYRVVDAWVRAGAVPSAPVSTAFPNPAAVTLRLDGRLIGRGIGTAGDGSSLWAASHSAIAEAARRLPVRNDALADHARSEAFARMTISLELAGAPVTFSPLTYDQVNGAIDTGLEGVGARFGDSFAAVFPASMLVNNEPPGLALAAAISQASGDATLAIPKAAEGQPGALARSRNAVFYRFPVTHLAQVAPGEPPTFLFRGGRIADDSTITEQGLLEFAGNLARRLRRMAPGPGDDAAPLEGVYWPFADKSDPPASTPLELALASIALQEYSLTLQSRGGMDIIDPAMEAQAAALRLLQRLHAMGDAAFTDLGAAGAVRYAAPLVLRRVYAEIDLSGLITGSDAALARAYSPEAGFSPGCTDRERGLVVFALVATSAPGSPERERAVGALRALYRETRPGMLVTHMPWLGRAELIAAGPSDPIPAGAALRELRDLVHSHQVTHADAGADDPDLVGGVVFTAGRAFPPTWNTARPFSFLATMLADARLTPAPERAEHLTHVLSSLRFLRQLAVDDAASYAAPNPDRARWGVRMSPWDQRQPPEATALSLITTCQTLGALQRFRVQPANQPHE